MPTVACLLQDLIFTAKLRETASHLGLEVVGARDPVALASCARGASLVVVDLRRPDALDALARLRDDPALADVPRVGFIEHARTEVMEAARALGCEALSKGRFSNELPRILAAVR